LGKNNLNYESVMRFQKKKITEEVRGILGKYLDGTEKEFREATERIVNLIVVHRMLGVGCPTVATNGCKHA
jgi:hypothetical protein